MGSREGLFLRWEIDAEMQMERRLKRKGRRARRNHCLVKGIRLSLVYGRREEAERGVHSDLDICGRHTGS